MSQFIETIKLQDGTLKNIQYHQLRFEKTRHNELGIRIHPRLDNVIGIPDGLDQGVFKCRVSYGEKIDLIEFEPVERKVIESLKLVFSNSISYDCKFSDRTSLEILFRLKGSCDDILIVKNGCITDSYYANVVFWDGTGWFTPDTPLLPGTMRAYLLTEGVIKEQRITPDDLGKFQKIILINALNSLDEGAEISTDAIRY